MNITLYGLSVLLTGYLLLECGPERSESLNLQSYVAVAIFSLLSPFTLALIVFRAVYYD